MEKVIKKFGGNSLKNEERIDLATREVVRSLENGNQVAVVVSAMGGYGDPYATDTLIELLEEVSPEIDSQKKDLMMSCGETISASLFSHYLDREGYSAVPMTGYKAGIFTDDDFGNAEVIDVDPARIDHHASQGRPVVLAGFQGRTVRGEITTLGRGGSDTTALVVADRWGVDRVELFTDVPGVAVADPDIVEDPEYFSSVSRKALLKLAKNGAEIIHHNALASIEGSDLPIYVKCPWDRRNETLITYKPSSKPHPIGIAIAEGPTSYEREIKEMGQNPQLSENAELILTEKDGKDLAVGPERREDIPKNAYKKTEGIALVTVVATIPDRFTEVRRKVFQSVNSDRYICRLASEPCLHFLVEGVKYRSLVKDIYRLYY